MKYFVVVHRSVDNHPYPYSYDTLDGAAQRIRDLLSDGYTNVSLIKGENIQLEYRVGIALGEQ